MMSVSDIPSNTQVCIIGGGPAGVIAAYLFARRGVSVILLEGEKDFDRAFRGDTLHASSMEILEQMGLADDILKQSHARIGQLSLSFTDGEITMADFTSMDSRYPFVAIIPEVTLLNYIVDKARQLSGFDLLMGAQVCELKQSDGKVIGVKFTYEENEYELAATLTIGADGRSSSARCLAKIELGKTSLPMDIVWFKLPLPKNVELKKTVSVTLGSGAVIVVINRRAYLQIGYVIMQGRYKQLREKGIEHFHTVIKQRVPELSAVIEEMKDWSQMAILSVVTGRAEKWYKDGLLLIGDAAHIMSPIGGVGINYAIQDAVAAVNQLTLPLKEDRLTVADLAKVQNKREAAVVAIQKIQSLIQNRIIVSALKSDKAFKAPLFIRIITKCPFFRKKFAHFLAYGRRHEKVESL